MLFHCRPVRMVLCGLSLFFVIWGLCSCARMQDTPAEPVDPDLNGDSMYLAVFGDVQVYTSSPEANEFYIRSVDWLTEQYRRGLKVGSVLQVGDVTENNKTALWNNFRTASVDAAGYMPFFVCTGNHDYDWGTGAAIADRSSTHINEYCHFPLSDSMIIDFYEGTSLENYVAALPDGIGACLLVLEFGPRTEVVEWAKEYVESHRTERFILMTHEWLTGKGERISSGSFAERQFKGFSSFSSPEDVWESVVKPNDNVVCVLCGHNGFFAKRFSRNDAGREVPQILFNLQYQENGGNGIVQLWEFPRESDYVNICCYDTFNRKWYLPDSTSVSFKFRY